MVKYTPQRVCSNCILCIFLVTYLLQVTFVMDRDVPIIWSATAADAIILRPDAIRHHFHRCKLCCGTGAVNVIHDARSRQLEFSLFSQ